MVLRLCPGPAQQIPGSSSAPCVSRLTRREFQAVASHGWSELFHQNDTFIMQSSLQHWDNCHTCRQEIRWRRLMKGELCQQSVYSHPTKTPYFKKHCIRNLPYVCHCNRKLKATVLVVNLEVILTYNVIKGLTFFINHVSSNLLGLKTKTPVGSRKSKPPRGALAPTPLLAGKNSCGRYSASSQRQKGEKKKGKQERPIAQLPRDQR